MATLQQAQQWASNAGFTGAGLATIVAIAEAESGLNASASNTTGNVAGTDRGILQINSYFHPEVSDSCAYDPQCAFNAAYQISHGGTQFSQWVTYTNGAYRQYVNGQQTQNQNSMQNDILGGLGGIGGIGGNGIGIQGLGGLFGQIGSDLGNAANQANPLNQVAAFVDAGALRVGLFLLGLALAGIGVALLLAKPAQIAGQAALQTAAGNLGISNNPAKQLGQTVGNVTVRPKKPPTALPRAKRGA